MQIRMLSVCWSATWTEISFIVRLKITAQQFSNVGLAIVEFVLLISYSNCSDLCARAYKKGD